MKKCANGVDQRLSLAANPCGISVYEWNLHTSEITIDDHSGILGNPTRTVILPRQSWENLFHADDRQSLREAFLIHLEENGPVMETEYRIHTGSDNYRRLLDRGVVTERDSMGKPSRINGVLIDISGKNTAKTTAARDCAEASTAIRRLEDERQAILAGSRGLAIIRYIDPHFRILWSNNEADMALALETKDGVSSQLYCYTAHGQTQPCPGCPVMRAFDTGKLQEIEHTEMDGSSFIRRCSPVCDATGRIVGVVLIAFNITEHKQTKAGLKTAHEFLHSLLENSPTPICVSDSDGRINTINQAWERTLGFTQEQSVGRLFRDIFPEETAKGLDRTNKKILKSHVPIESELSINSPTGLHHFHVVKFPLRNESGQTVAVGTILLDVTTRKCAEQELTKRETELKQKSRQLSEMNTALRVLLKQREGDQRELEERIVSNVNQLVLPYVNKLKEMHLNDAQASYLEIVEIHLKDIVTPFLRQIVDQYPHMTSKELQVAAFVKEGRSNKEIANLMNVSLNTVEIHRYHLRKKLGLQNKKTGLRSCLLSLNRLPS